MTAFTVLLLGFAAADLAGGLMRGGKVGSRVLATVAGAAAGALAAWALGVEAVPGLTMVAVLAAFVAMWRWTDSLDEGRKPLAVIWVLVAAVLVAVVFGGRVEASGGELGAWYSELDWAFVPSVPSGQVAIGVAGLLFLSSSSNRLVASVLQLAGTPTERGEQRLKGGRLLGTMERWLVVGMILAGEPAGAAVVFAAKGLLRFPTIRDSGESDEAPDGGEPGWTEAEYSEYFLVGTFASLLIAAAIAVLIAASG